MADLAIVSSDRGVCAIGAAVAGVGAVQIRQRIPGPAPQRELALRCTRSLRVYDVHAIR
jgi:hypothetical protein